MEWDDQPDGTHWKATVTQDWSDGWRLRAEFVEQQGQPVLRELRISPQPRRPTPHGGITARRLRTVQVEPLLDRARQTARRHLGNELAEKELAALLHEPLLRRRGRRGHDDRFYAEVAMAYEGLHASSKRPIVDLAARLHLSPSRARDLVHEARVRGFLTAGQRGRAGGVATETARGLLADDHG